MHPLGCRVSTAARACRAEERKEQQQQQQQCASRGELGGELVGTSCLYHSCSPCRVGAGCGSVQWACTPAACTELQSPQARHGVSICMGLPSTRAARPSAPTAPPPAERARLHCYAPLIKNEGASAHTHDASACQALCHPYRRAPLVAICPGTAWREPECLHAHTQPHHAERILPRKQLLVGGGRRRHP